MKRRHSFGSVGFTEMARIATKNNRNLITKRKPGASYATTKTRNQNNQEKVDPQKLKEIRLRLRKERKDRVKTLFIIAICISFLLVLGIIMLNTAR